MNRSATMQEISDLLDAERAALLRGDFAALERLIPAKEKFCNLLAVNPPNREILQKFHKQFKQNQMLLAAANDGIAVVRSALVGLSPARLNVTYGPAGQRETLQDPAHHLSRKF